MAEQSYIFDFTRVPSFFENFNVGFFVDEMYKPVGDEVTPPESTGCFELVWCSYGDGTNIDDYLNEDGSLDETACTIHDTEVCDLDWVQDEFGDATIGLHSAVTFTVGDANVPLKALFLRNCSSGYVMGYCINMVSFTVTNEAVFDEDVIFWDITRLSNGG